ncbi:MAG: hypothetical protein ACKO5X_04925 [Limnohabitans sp.]
MQASSPDIHTKDEFYSMAQALQRQTAQPTRRVSSNPCIDLEPIACLTVAFI